MRRSLQTTDDPESNGDLLSAGLSAQSTESLSSIADTREVGDFAEPAVAHRHDAIVEFHDAEVVGDHDGGDPAIVCQIAQQRHHVECSAVVEC